MDFLMVPLLLAALLLAARLPDSKAIIVFETGGSQVGPSVCPGPCRCGLLNTGVQQRAGPDAGEGAGEGGELSRRRRFATEGERVRANLYPWLAAVTRLPPYSGFNAGALVSDRHVLTAASAVTGVPLRNLRVTLSVGGMCGSPDSTALNMTVADVSSLSGSFTSDVNGDDLALLRLSHPVRFSSTLSPVCLPPNERATYTGRNAMVVGFGGNATEPLVADDDTAANATAALSGFLRRCRPRALLLPVVSSRDCATAASSTSASGRVSTTGCVGSPGAPQVVCPSDAGSLIQVRGTRGEVQLIGIMTSTNNCTEGETGPAQFTLTAPNLRWLLRRTAGSCFCAAP